MGKGKEEKEIINLMVEIELQSGIKTMAENNG